MKLINNGNGLIFSNPPRRPVGSLPNQSKCQLRRAVDGHPLELAVILALLQQASEVLSRLWSSEHIGHHIMPRSLLTCHQR
eukprot:238043-Pyramimonas_sp.AAC.1